MNVFFFPVWGEQYINNFLNICLPCLDDNLSKLSSKEISNSKLEIWTSKKDIKLFKNNLILKRLKKKLKVNYEHIDVLLNLKKNFSNKYQFLAFIQYNFICSHIKKYKYLWFLYPDFMFSNNLIKNSLTQLIKKKVDLLLIPAPQVDEETTKQDIFINKNKNINKMVTDNIHHYVKFFEIDNIKDHHFPFLCSINKKNFIFRNFHIHPLAISSRNYKVFLKPFFPSFDAGVPEYFLDKKIYIPNSDKFGICVSLANKSLANEYDFKNQPKNFEDSIVFAFKNYNQCHIKFSQNKYYINKNNSLIMSRKEKNG